MDAVVTRADLLSLHTVRRIRLTDLHRTPDSDTEKPIRPCDWLPDTPPASPEAAVTLHSRRLPFTGSGRALQYALSPPRPARMASASFGRSVTGVEVAKTFSEELKQAANDAERKLKRPPKLVGFLASEDEPSAQYAQWTEKSCREVGIEFELRKIAVRSGKQGAVSGTGVGEVEERILEANLDDSVDGIMVYYPLFGSNGRQDQYIQQVVNPLKDVEGLGFTYLFNLYHNVCVTNPRAVAAVCSYGDGQTRLTNLPSPGQQVQEVKSILPCTPLAIVKALEYCNVYNPVLPYGQRAFGKTIAVINRSEVVGRPLAALLANDGARVFSVDVGDILQFTRRSTSSGSATLPRHAVAPCDLSLAECLRSCDVVIAGVPSDDYKIATADLKDGVVAVNFSSSKNFESDIKDKASLYLPAVGKITIAMLQRNLLRLTSYRQTADDAAPAS